MRSDLAIGALAVALVLGGAALLVAGGGAAVGFALVAVGSALVTVLEARKRRHRRAR